MTNDTPRIQQKGRTGEDRKEKGILKAQHGKSKGGQVKKPSAKKIERLTARYHSLWMREIKSHKHAFPDWSYLGVLALAKRKRDAMTAEEKANHNRKYREYVKARIEKNPDLGLRQRQQTENWRSKNRIPVSRYLMMTDAQKEEYKSKGRDWRITKYNDIKQKAAIRYRQMPEAEKIKYKINVRLWKKNNPRRNLDHNKSTVKKRIAKDPAFKLQTRLRDRLKSILRSGMISSNVTRSTFLGCTPTQLALHLESQFKSWMTWENYGKRWHVDHILPCASFDHSDPKQVAQCWHWLNLRPLEAKKNMIKSSKITEPQMHLMIGSVH